MDFAKRRNLSRVATSGSTRQGAQQVDKAKPGAVSIRGRVSQARHNCVKFPSRLQQVDTSPGKPGERKNIMQTMNWTERKQAALERKRQRIEGGLDLVDGVLDAMQTAEQAKQGGRMYPHRDEIPESFLGYADWFVSATGLEPDKRTLTDWIAEFSYWMSKGLTTDDLKKAQAETDVVYRPGTLTLRAVALKAKARATVHQSQIFRAADQDELKAVPPPSDLYEQTRARLRAKLAQDRVGTTENDPKPIGDVLKGLQS